MFALNMVGISSIRFGDVRLKSTNSQIGVWVIIILIDTCAAAKPPQGATASTFNIQSTNAGISGAFNATDSLTIVTTNSPVSVRIGAVNEKAEKPTELFIRTTNEFVPHSLSRSAS